MPWSEGTFIEIGGLKPQRIGFFNHLEMQWITTASRISSV